MIKTNDEMVLRGEAVRVKKAHEHVVTFDRLNPPPRAAGAFHLPEPKVYVISMLSVKALIESGELAPATAGKDG